MIASEPTTLSLGAEEQAHTSVLLRRLIDEAPPDFFTLGWLLGKLPKNSFGFILLFLAIIALLPVISVVARIFMVILLCQIILGYHCPVLPGWLTRRKLPSRYLIKLKLHIIPALDCLENVVRPRWPVMLVGTRRLTAFIASLILLLSLPAPLPLANMPPATASILMALAYIEHDGLLLVIALFFAIAMLLIVIWAFLQAHLI